MHTESFSINNFGSHIHTLDITCNLDNIYISQIARLLPHLPVLQTLRLTSIECRRDNSLIDPKDVPEALYVPSLHCLYICNTGFSASPSRHLDDNAFACSSVDLLSLFNTIHNLHLNEAGLSILTLLGAPPLTSLAAVEALGTQHLGKPCVQRLKFEGDRYTTDTALVHVLRASGIFNGLRTLELAAEIADANKVLRSLSHLVRCWSKSGGAFKARAGVPHDLHLPSVPRCSHTEVFVPPPLPTGFGPSKCRAHPRASELGRHQRYSAWQAIYAEGSHPREQEGSLVGCRRSHGAARGSGQAEPARVE